MKKIHSEEEAIEYCFSKLKQSLLGQADYDRLRQYKARYKKGELSQNGLNTLLEYFGFTMKASYEYDPEKDNSK